MLIYNLLIFGTSLECPSQSSARGWRRAAPFLTNHDTLIKLGAYLCSNITGIKCCCSALKIIMKFSEKLKKRGIEVRVSFEVRFFISIRDFV